MAYFNHAFCKTFIAETVSADLTGTISTPDLARGEIAIFDSSWSNIRTADVATTTEKLLYLVQGSLRQSDNIGNNPGHGGYAESVKSKGINPSYISRLWSGGIDAATQSTSEICVASDCAPCGENLFLRLDVKGSPALRFLNHNAYAIGDSSGDAAANGGPLPGLCCADGQEYLDPALALAAAAQMLLADPIIKPFVQEGTTGGVPSTVGAGTSASGTFFGAPTTYSSVAVKSTSGGGTITGATVDVTAEAGVGATAVINVSTFNLGGFAVGDTIVVDGGDVGGTTTTDDITFTITALALTGVKIQLGAAAPQYYTIEEVLSSTSAYTASLDPVADQVTACVTFAGAYVDTQFGNCSFDTRDHYEKEPVQIIASLLDETGNPCNDCGTVTNTPGTMAQTSGEKVLRDLLMTDAYMQSPYNQGNANSARIREIEGSDDVVNFVDRTSLYKAYYIQHSIPRFHNPTGVFDNDQYVYVIYVDQNDAGTITAMDALMTSLSTLTGLPFTDPID